MKNLWFLIPATIVLILTWFHRLAYENILLAQPGIHVCDARAIATAISGLALIAYGLWRAHR